MILHQMNQIIKKASYIGAAETTFKLRHANQSFNINKYKNDTEILKEVWRIKAKNYTPKITWKIIRKCKSYNLSSNKCYLCLNEKLEIALYTGDNLLNKKSELISKCRHQQQIHAFTSRF